jgi:DNA-binding CsgD family transcriptional regulator
VAVKPTSEAYSMEHQKLEYSDEGKCVREIIGNIDVGFLMKTLPRRQRMALGLKLKGFSYREIGGKMNISINTVHNYLTLARNKLKRIMKNSP